MLYWERNRHIVGEVYEAFGQGFSKMFFDITLNKVTGLQPWWQLRVFRLIFDAKTQELSDMELVEAKGFGTLDAAKEHAEMYCGNITVYFTDMRKPAEYSKGLYEELKNEPIVSRILDSNTGEIIYDKEAV